ncbi:nucleotide-binding protein [Crocosphaera sp. XPORK-15E]|uniref:nucleotide-binding protein n=1 Tax=Crocosphaera sp. XPORK-15E TaxID=3110247 RepID=UPI002B2119B2|nr:nucleotide-binding protein [Crocosphaera sp. XPORK-15E]MEA5535294.1 nucleotide-binding protein [Crocosphaera sp. XPORK-15E]
MEKNSNNQNANLRLSKKKASQQIQIQIDQGREIINSSISIQSEQEFQQCHYQYSKWAKYNIELLKRIFDNDDYANEYTSYGFHFTNILRLTLNEGIDTLQDNIERQIHRLESICDRIDLIPELSTLSTTLTTMNTYQSEKDIFIVHGHDNEAKREVDVLIRKLGFNPIILHEQPNQGKTIIEKFENYSNVSFAIILLTPDDEGKVRNKDEELKPRARQNVILELGYFMGKLGRDKVCALYKEKVEIPSDFSGVLYTMMDNAGAWKTEIAKEMKKTGLEVDLNKL